MNKEQLLEFLGLTLTKNEQIKNNKIKYTFTDEEGYKYFLSIDNIRNYYKKIKNKDGATLAKFFNGNIYTEYNIQNFLLKNNSNILLKTFDARKATDKLLWECSICGKTFIKSWNQIYPKCLCPICTKNSNAENKSRNKLNQIKEYCFKEKNIIITSQEYKSNKDPLDYYCKYHTNFKRNSSWAYIQKTKNLCPFCIKEQNKIKNKNNFLEKFNLINITNQYILLGEYKNSYEPIKLYCKKCEEEFYISPYHLLEGHGCPKCNKSIGEKKISNFLKKYNINFEEQKSFEKCKNIKKLTYDFFIPEANLLIEYQGEQHYKPIEVFGGAVAFEKQILRDGIKQDYATKAGYELLTISYLDFNNIEKIIFKKMRQYVDLDKLANVFDKG